MLQKDIDRFYGILIPMLDWTKELKDVKAELKAASKDKSRPHSEENDVLTIIWERPELIDQYLAEKGNQIPVRDREVLAGWRTHFVPGPFIVERFTNMGAIFISPADGNVYLVNGIIDAIEDTMVIEKLPCLVYTSLIPYNECIVYDSTMIAMPHFFNILDDDAPQLVTQVYETAKRFNTTIRRLPPKQGLMTKKQQELMLKVMQPVLKETLGKVNLAEIASQASKNPNIHPIAEKDLSVYNKLLRKAHRTSKEWDTILEILYSGDVFTATPLEKTSKLTDVEGVLCHKGALMAFTTLEKSREYLTYLYKKEPSSELVRMQAIPFEGAVNLADQYKKTLYIDFPVRGLFKKCIVYDSNTEEFSASLILRR